MVIDGGLSTAGGLLGDSYSLDLASRTWYRLAIRPRGEGAVRAFSETEPRCLHSVAPFGNGFLTFGGISAGGVPRARAEVVCAPGLAAEAAESAAAAAAVRTYLAELPNRDQALLTAQERERELAACRTELSALRGRADAQAALHAEAALRGEAYQTSLKRLLVAERQGAKLSFSVCE